VHAYLIHIKMAVVPGVVPVAAHAHQTAAGGGACEAEEQQRPLEAQGAGGAERAAGAGDDTARLGEKGAGRCGRDDRLDLDLEEAIARANASHNEHILTQWQDCFPSPLPPLRADRSPALSAAPTGGADRSPALSAAPTRRSSSSSSFRSLSSSPRAAESTPKKSVRWCLLGLPVRERLPRTSSPPSSLRSRSSDEVRKCYLARLGIHPPVGPLPAALSIAPLSVVAPGPQDTSMAFLGGWCM
jgi:hypothetical protein